MKIDQKPSASKLIARFDNELKDLIMSDLKAFTASCLFLRRNKQAVTRQTLSVA